MPEEDFWIINAREQFRNEAEFLAQLGRIGVFVNGLRFEISGKAVYLMINFIPFKTVETIESMVPEITKRLEKINYG